MASQHYAETIERFTSLDTFADAVRTLPVPWELKTDVATFSASIERRVLDEVSFGAVRFEPCHCLRSSVEREPATEPYMCLTFQRQGRQRMSWHDRDEIVAPGEMILWDALEPMLLENTETAHAYNFWFPKRLAERRVGRVADFIGQKASTNEAATRLLGQHMEVVYNELGNLPELARSSVINSTIDLIFACIPARRSESDAIGRKAELMREAQQEIAGARDLADVSPVSVASSLGISVRYLQQLFADADMTFSGYVGEIRLERAREALTSGHFQKASVTEIAHWFGFFDSSHFTHSFKKRYGITPSKYRNLN